MTFHGYVSIQSRGVVALPAELRRRLGLDQPGAQLEISERADGVLEMRPFVPVLASQHRFWTSRWQEREREVAAHLAAGRVDVHQDGDAFLAYIDALTDEP